jgi:hypothetical protein
MTEPERLEAGLPGPVCQLIPGAGGLDELQQRLGPGLPTRIAIGRDVRDPVLFLASSQAA